MKKIFRAFLLALAFLFIASASAPSQTLSEIYVSEAGNVLRAIFLFDPGFPAVALVNGGGVLVWINVEIPGAIVEIYANGHVQLVERTSPGSISYADGRIRRIGEVDFEYENARLRKIDTLLFTYETGRGVRIGDVRFEYDTGALRKVTGTLPGVALQVSSIVEFRRPS